MSRKLYNLIVQRSDGSSVDTVILSDDPEDVFLYTSIAVLEKAGEAVNSRIIGRVNTETGFKFYLTVGDIQHELQSGDAIIVGSDGRLYPLQRTLLNDIFHVRVIT